MKNITFVFDGGVEDLKLNEEMISKWINTVSDSYDHVIGDITLIFCDENKILSVNKEFLDHDYYTDIITFDYTHGGIIAGELYICTDVVAHNAQLYDSSFNEELHRVIIHGVLHLIGFFDAEDEEKIAMRNAENEALKLLF